MRKTMLVVITLLGAVIQSCHKIKGDGPTISKTYNLSGFSAVDAGIDADVYYTQDSFYKVEIQAQQNILNVIQTPIENGTLVLQFEKYKNVSRHERIAVYITTPNISGLRINGSGTINVLQPVNATSLAVGVNGSGSINMAGVTGTTLIPKISGSGTISISSGTVNTLTTSISGSGTINVQGVKAASASIETSGSGNTSVWVSDHMNVRISGSGCVYYKGQPTVHLDISGSGQVMSL